jgi:hypothetical protein
MSHVFLLLMDRADMATARPPINNANAPPTERSAAMDARRPRLPGRDFSWPLKPRG